MRIIKSIPILLFFILGLSAGILLSNQNRWEIFITPLIASTSVLMATFLAIKNLEQSRRHEVIKRTLDFLAKRPDTDGSLFEARVAINNIILNESLHEHYDHYDHIYKAIEKLTTTQVETIIKYLNFYNELYHGVELKLYDSELVFEKTSTISCAIWRDFWPIARHNQLASLTHWEEYYKGLPLPYSYLEKYAKKNFKGDIINLVKPKGRYKLIHQQ